MERDRGDQPLAAKGRAAAVDQLPARVLLTEVGPRDGFQMEPKFIPTERKIEIVKALARTGLSEIQVTSFVRPAAIPQLADAEQVMAGVGRTVGLRRSALIANERGAERALAARVDALDFVVSVTDSHCLSNTNMSSKAALAKAGIVAALGREARVEVTIGFAVALGCPFEGIPPYPRLEGMVGRAIEDFGYRRVMVADTVGMANPRLVRQTMERLRARFPEATFGLHLHNTRNMGLANLLAGLEAGIDHFDTSVAGLGGCPYAPGASGNIATEDVVNMLDAMNITSGIQLEGYLEVARSVAAEVGHSDSAVLLAGPSSRRLGRYSGSQLPQS